jgi:hypothetical protein
MTTWTTIYLILAVLAGGLGIWNLARGRNPYLSVAGLLWFVAVLLRFFVPQLADVVIVSGIPELGALVLYAAVPLFMILAFFNVGTRR